MLYWNVEPFFALFYLRAIVSAVEPQDHDDIFRTLLLNMQRFDDSHAKKTASWSTDTLECLGAISQ